MIVFRKLHGSYLCPALRQGSRKHDGVRGVFATRPIERGSLLMEVPLRYCCFPYGLASSATSSFSLITPTQKKEERRMNSYISLFPEFALWRQRLCRLSSALRDSVNLPALQASASNEHGETTSLCLSPSEAALVLSVALRFFSEHVALLPSVDLFRMGRKISNFISFSLAVSPPRSSVASAYVNYLPMHLFLENGVESFCTPSVPTLESFHMCLEQLSWNLKDEVLQYATNEEYTLLDAHSSTFDDIILVALYIVRSRILPVTLLSPGHSDRVVPALMPGIDSMNHAVAPNAAVVISPVLPFVVARALRYIPAGEEVTLQYDLASGEGKWSSRDSHHFVSRYLMQSTEYSSKQS